MTEQLPTTFQFGVPWEDATGYAQAVRRDNTVYISGQLAHDQEGNFIGAGDFDAQVKASFANLDAVLAGFGATRADLASVTLYAKDFRRHFEALGRLQAEYFGELRPTSTLIGVAELALPDQLFEVSAVATLDR